jgi:RNA polymerase sigma-70 factor, ECF subfamily
MKHDCRSSPPTWNGLALLALADDSSGVSGDEQRLIWECLNGAPSAFGELVRRHQGRLFSAVSRLLSNVEDSQDVVQEAFLHAYQHLGSFKGSSRFFTWLYRIAMNAALSLHRKRFPVPGVFWPNGDGGPDLADPSETAQPGYCLEQAERAEAVRQALDQLSVEHRALLVLKDREGMKYEQMAEVLGVPIGTVRSRLHRARLELRALLE